MVIVVWVKFLCFMKRKGKGTHERKQENKRKKKVGKGPTNTSPVEEHFPR